MKHYALLALFLLPACTTVNKVTTQFVEKSDVPICSKPITGNTCIDEVEKDYCDKMKALAPEVQEIVQHDVICAHYDGNQAKLDEFKCYKDDVKAQAAMKIYWDKPEGQALVYFPAKYEKALGACRK